MLFKNTEVFIKDFSRAVYDNHRQKNELSRSGSDLYNTYCIFTEFKNFNTLQKQQKLDDDLQIDFAQFYHALKLGLHDELKVSKHATNIALVLARLQLNDKHPILSYFRLPEDFYGIEGDNEYDEVGWEYGVTELGELSEAGVSCDLKYCWRSGIPPITLVRKLRRYDDSLLQRVTFYGTPECVVRLLNADTRFAHRLIGLGNPSINNRKIQLVGMKKQDELKPFGLNLKVPHRKYYI